ncbi:MAG: hypothetical protein M1470_12515 [Bacteroidetes bacterium]|nr:hypothetical protein [Bacteroidota bacterium]MCL5737987.1 hypothetical protein [Bacteroidota bacterium]
MKRKINNSSKIHAVKESPKELFELHCTDCLEWLERAEGEEFDLTFFDPPFNQGGEAIRDKNNERFHKQQSPIALLLRIVLSSSKPGDTIFDPFAGTGTTLVVANQLQRRSVGIEIDPENIECIQQRLTSLRDADDSERFRKDYICTEDINRIWGSVLDNDRDEGEWERLLSEVS